MRFTKPKQALKTGKNPIAQRLIAAMEKPPHLTYEGVETLRPVNRRRKDAYKVQFAH